MTDLYHRSEAVY